MAFAQKFSLQKKIVIGLLCLICVFIAHVWVGSSLTGNLPTGIVAELGPQCSSEQGMEGSCPQDYACRLIAGPIPPGLAPPDQVVTIGGDLYSPSAECNDKKMGNDDCYCFKCSEGYFADPGSTRCKECKGTNVTVDDSGQCKCTGSNQRCDGNSANGDPICCPIGMCQQENNGSYSCIPEPPGPGYGPGSGPGSGPGGPGSGPGSGPGGPGSGPGSGPGGPGSGPGSGPGPGIGSNGSASSNSSVDCPHPNIRAKESECVEQCYIEYWQCRPTCNISGTCVFSPCVDQSCLDDCADATNACILACPDVCIPVDPSPGPGSGPGGPGSGPGSGPGPGPAPAPGPGPSPGPGPGSSSEASSDSSEVSSSSSSSSPPGANGGNGGGSTFSIGSSTHSTDSQNSGTSEGSEGSGGSKKSIPNSSQGSEGSDGSKGSDDSQGSQGSDVSQHSDGSDDSSASQASDGSDTSYVHISNGSQFSLTSNGSQGSDGSDGSDGSNGSADSASSFSVACNPNDPDCTQTYCCYVDFCTPFGSCENPYQSIEGCLAECGVVTQSSRSFIAYSSSNSGNSDSSDESGASQRSNASENSDSSGESNGFSTSQFSDNSNPSISSQGSNGSRGSNDSDGSNGSQGSDGSDSSGSSNPLQHCGDGQLQQGEQCEDNPLFDCGSGRSCDLSSCTCFPDDTDDDNDPEDDDGGALDSCGDGQLQRGEQCDVNYEYFCTSGRECNTNICTCIVPSDPYFCGNGELDPGEECDDGNTRDNDGCTAQCELGPVIAGCFTDRDCSNGVCIDGSCSPCFTDNECDEGICRNGECQGPTLVAAASVCGNGSLEYGEECDDSNRRDDDGCSSTCLLEIGICGDGVVQTLLGEQCEASLHDKTLPYSCISCRYLSTFCGNGELDPGEECDNGANNSTSADAACRPDCSLSRCGDNILDSGEQCDDGNKIAGDGCSRFCTSEETQLASGQFSSQSIVDGEFAFEFPQYQPQQYQFPQYPTGQPLPYQLPLAQLQPLIQTQGPIGDTGPAAVAVIGAGAAAGFGWMRRKR